MKLLFNKIDVISTSVVGKKNKKMINKALGLEILAKDNDYIQMKLRNKTEVYTENKVAVLFCYSGKFICTIKYLEHHEPIHTTIYLDDGAVGPLQRGSNVMAPGIYKYINKCTGEFKKGDAVIIYIINKGVLAIGTSLIDKTSIDSNTTGEAVQILHIKTDELYKCY